MARLGERHPLFVAAYLQMHSQFHPYRAGVVGPVTGAVLEIGAGDGANFPYYGDVERLVVTDPNPLMLDLAARSLARSGRTAELVAAQAEALPFPDQSFDAVVGTLVLCSVESPASALAEIRRVLKPGGTFRFMEHVGSEGGWRRLYENLFTPIYHLCAGGCHLNRDTVGAVRAAGFSLVELSRPRRDWTVYLGAAVKEA